ncbi:MAG: ROK family glucokinase [Bacillota bacterium]|nr:ROK family glucokinase [Bacillota bacterium]
MFYVGIDLGGTNIAAGVVDENGKIIHKDSIPTHRERKDVEVIKDMAMLALKVIKDSGKEIADIKSIGIGSPGVPNNEKGILVYACNLNFKNAPIREEMQKYVNLPVILDNDANCAALAECVAGAAKGTKHSVTITLGTGLGGGVVIDGKIYSGFNNSASELGHSIIAMDGEQCTCGRKGCYEAYASATALIRQTKRAAVENKDSMINKLVNGDLNKIDAKTSFDAARAGDETGRKVVAQYIRYIAEGLINVINTFAPEVIVIGGGVCKEGEYLLKPLREIVYSEVYFKEEPQTQIKAAQMGNDAGIVGAAMLGR